MRVEGVMNRFIKLTRESFLIFSVSAVESSDRDTAAAAILEFPTEIFRGGSVGLVILI